MGRWQRGWGGAKAEISSPLLQFVNLWVVCNNLVEHENMVMKHVGKHLKLRVVELHQLGPVALPLVLEVLLVGGQTLQCPGVAL